MSQEKMRIYQLAKEIGISNNEVMDVLSQWKIPFKSHQSVIDEETAEKIRKFIKKEKAQRKEKPMSQTELAEEKAPKIQIREGITLKELSEKIQIKAKDIIQRLFTKGLMVTVNQSIDSSLAQEIAKEFEIDIEVVSLEEEQLIQAEEKPEDLVSRPPVVTVMGHVDHGKTTLLDAIRKTNVVAKESGGITQHIGAYQVKFDGKPIVFIDTPGHEAFTRMRARGAKVTDLVILVIAADDGVMPQTIEAINHAKAAGVPILIAINKVDKPNSDVQKVKKQLTHHGVIPEELGGDAVCVEVSAKEKIGINDLLEMIILVSDMVELKANPKISAQGVVLEARLDSKKGPLATVIIQHGILRPGDAFISGICYGKAKALFDEHGNRIREAGPSTPVEILGFNKVPTAGDLFQVVANIDKAKQIVAYRQSQLEQRKIARPERLTLDDLFKRIKEGEVKELSLVLKADVQGSIEVLTDTLPKLSTDEVKIKIIHAATGTISESDVLLAAASKAIIIGFNIRPSRKIIEVAERENVEIRVYNVIYKLTEDIKKALTGLIEPKVKEIYLGTAEVKRIFRIPRVGVVAGCYVTDGKILRKERVKVIRNDVPVYEGRVSSLKRVKEDVNEVTKGFECGLAIENYNDIKVGDILEFFTTEKVKPQ